MARRPRGRPTTFDQKVGAEICEIIANGGTLPKTLCEKKIGVSTFYAWLDEFPDFLEAYARAKATRAQQWADQIIEIADESEYDIDEDGKINWEHIKRSDLRISTRKWLLEKQRPDEYGMRQRTEITGKDGAAIEVKTTPQIAPPSMDQWLEMVARCPQQPPKSS